ncbi:MAG: S8 family serine peptidase [Bacteroidia bacterium]|nr:S8 family serine peptidase [Bacteroidia bacterium]
MKQMRNGIKGNMFSNIHRSLLLMMAMAASGLLTAQNFPARYDTLISLVQDQLHSEVLDSLKLSGKGVKIAVLDAGFKHANRHPALAHLWQNGQILSTWDFVDDQANVLHHSDHGTQVLSALAGRYGNRKLGYAQDAQFFLFRTEHERKEEFFEEENWIKALHWADSLGADILVSSVNFTYERYSLADLNGERIPVSKAAAEAVAKGMVIIVAMGNEGDSPWRYMGAPADVPGVISVGGSMPSLPMRIQFSSIGPNALGVRKPEISAPGYVLGPKGRKSYTETAGTSFAAPMIGGIAACLLELHPDWTNTQVYDEICRLGHTFPFYDYELGYGIPDLRKLLPSYTPVDTSNFRVFFVGDTVFVRFDSALVADSAAFPYGRILHYHLQSADSTLAANYEVRIPNSTNAYYFIRRRLSRGILRIWFAGYLWEERIEMLE